MSATPHPGGLMLAELPPLAHAGHYLAGVLYLLPVVLVGLFLWLQGRRDRTSEDEDPSDERHGANLDP